MNIRYSFAEIWQDLRIFSTYRYIWYTDVAILYRFHDKLRCGLIAFVVRLKWDLIRFIMSIHWNALKEKMEIFDIMPRYISIYMHMEIQISQSVVKIDKYSLSNNCWKATKIEPCTFQLHHTICFLFNPVQSISNSLQSINMFNSCLLFLNWFASSSLLSFHNSVKNYHIFFLTCSIGP